MLLPGFSPGTPLFPVSPHVLSISSAGISTCCPSTTPLGLVLGPDFPRADQLYPGLLGYSAMRILTSFSLLIPAFSLFTAPLLLIGTVSTLVKMLPYQSVIPVDMTHSQASVSCFSPGNFRRRTSRLVSYYALFECLAASEPTA